MGFPVRGASAARFLLAAPYLAAAAAAGIALSLTGCATPAAAEAAETHDMRVVVELAVPSSDAVAIATDASRQAGLPVTYATSVNGAWHALILHCADAAACDAAVARLRQSGLYAAVEVDGRKRRVMN